MPFDPHVLTSGKPGVAGEPVLVGIDVGSGLVRAIAFDPAGGKIAENSVATPVNLVKGGAEYDPEAVYGAVKTVLANLGRALAGRPVAGMAVSSFGESCVLVGADGRALTPSIAWYDTRTEPQEKWIIDRIGRDRIFDISGHAVASLFTVMKLMWMREHWPDRFARARTVLMMADWIAFRLCGEAATDPSLAARTLYFDIRSRRWSDEMLGLVGLDTEFPAPLTANGTPLGLVHADMLAETGLAGSPIVAVGGHDHVLGAVGAGLGAGTAVNSLGTAEALLLATDKALDDPELYRRGYFQGAIEIDRWTPFVAGGLFSSGGALSWLRDIIRETPREELIAAAAKIPPGSHGVIFLPHFVSGPPPDPDEHARGAFLGLSADTTPAVLYRAVLEGLAMQTRMILDGAVGLSGVEAPNDIKLIGGATRNRLFRAIKANVFARPLRCAEEPEATALGAAMLAGVGAGVYPSLEAAVAQLERREFTIDPDGSVGRYEQLRTQVFEPASHHMRRINRRLAGFAGSAP